MSMETTARGTVSGLIVDSDLPMGAYDITFTTGGIEYTDLPMLDYKCGVCGKEFKENEDVILRIRKIKKTKETKRPLILLVPIHRGTCSIKKGIKWRLKDEHKL